MAAVRILAIVLALAACDDVKGFEGEVPPLATIHFEVTGDFEAVRMANANNVKLRVALVWGSQWLPEPFCFLPPESAEAEAVVNAGCRDPLGFVPDRSSDTVPIEVGVPASLSLFELPSADIMVGDVTARIAYASMVVFDDRNDNERFDLGRFRRPDEDFDQPQDPLMFDTIYGASFVTMTEPDVRVVLREGGYNEKAAFYPRSGCGVPAPGFSVAAAGGFTREIAIASTLAGILPPQDPSTCVEADTEDLVIPIPLRATKEVAEVGCRGRDGDGAVEYEDPPVEGLDMTNKTFACTEVPDFGTGETEGITQLVITTRSDDRCRGLAHYVLKGCEDDLTCDVPEWDYTATPPSWWPCPR
jgi:hypothetical protein